MKYWFFDGNDVVGPFTTKELVANKGFGATSLICPEEFSDDGDHWQPAGLFAEVKALLIKNAPEESDATFEEEMDSLLKERSPLSFDESPTDSPALEIPKKPSKPGPIEDYFNNIKEEDLGDILGIPDPNDNSDMDLAHALEKQLAKTSSTRRRQLEEEEKAAQENVPDPIEATHHVATATEVFATKAPLAKDEPPTLPPLPSSTLPVLENEQATKPAAAIQFTSDEPEELANPQPAQALALQTKQNVVAATDFANPSAEKSTQEQPAPAKEDSDVKIIPNPALLRAEKIEVNSVRARLKQTQEMKDFLNETQNSHLKRQYKAQRRILIILLATLAIMIALVCVMQFKKRSGQTVSPAPVTTPAKTYTQELLNETPLVATPAPAQTVEPESDSSQEQIALSTVQNYVLSGNRGTIANYLNRLYQTQLTQGYSANWGVEPLYKDTYIVKYRLTKTRKEPIIYVFQVNTATRKLTGALNNISLDLVGKI